MPENNFGSDRRMTHSARNVVSENVPVDDIETTNHDVAEELDPALAAFRHGPWALTPEGDTEQVRIRITNCAVERLEHQLKILRNVVVHLSLAFEEQAQDRFVDAQRFSNCPRTKVIGQFLEEFRRFVSRR